MERRKKMNMRSAGGLRKALAAVLISAMCVCGFTGDVMAKTTARKDATAGIWKIKGSTVTVTTSSGKRKYTLYNQRKPKSSDIVYWSAYGCVTTGLAMAASGLGSKATPWSIHSGSVKSKYSEAYALKKLRMRKQRRAMSLRLASQILSDMGIKNRRVTSFSSAQAYKDIKTHLKAGKPVLVKVKSGQHSGIKFTNAHHTLVLVGIVNDYVVFLNPSTGGVNTSRVGQIRSKINIKLSTLIHSFMYSSKSGTGGAYVTSTRSSGGYILVG